MLVVMFAGELKAVVIPRPEGVNVQVCITHTNIQYTLTHTHTNKVLSDAVCCTEMEQIGQIKRVALNHVRIRIRFIGQVCEHTHKESGLWW